MESSVSRVNGTDESRTGAAITALTRVGTLLFAGWILWLFQVMYRVTQLAESRLATAWEERIEALAFLTFPPNLSLFALAATAAATATWLAGPMQGLGLAVLLRSLRWSANALIAVAALSVLVELFGGASGLDSIESVAFRLGGLVSLVGISYMCLAAGRTAPGG